MLSNRKLRRAEGPEQGGQGTGEKQTEKRSHMDPSIPLQLGKNGEDRIRQSETSDKELIINLPLSVTRANPGLTRPWVILGCFFKILFWSTNQ